jgi:DNA-binding response OmpR family regulator
MIEFVVYTVGLSMDEGESRKRRVLVVDDDQRIVRFISVKLRAAGYDVTAAANGEEALKLTELENPDVMVLDLLMPVMDGIEVLRRLRPCHELPVIVLTARTDACEDAMSLGASAFLTKPFNPDDLVEKIRSVLNHTR